MKKEILEKFYQHYRLIIFPLIIILSNMILIVFIIYPQISSILTASKEEREAVKRSEVLESKAEVLAGYDKADLVKKAGIVLRAYPQEKDFGQVLGILQELASKLGFSIVSLTFSPGSEAKSGSSQSFSVKLEILGPKISLANLFSNIEDSSRIMRLSNFEITSARETDIVSVVAVIEVFYASLPTGFGILDSPLPELTQKDEELMAKLISTTPVSLTPQVAAPLAPRGKANPFE